jgi:hypothetical protein
MNKNFRDEIRFIFKEAAVGSTSELTEQDFGKILMESFNGVQLFEDATLPQDLEKIANSWSALVKKMVEGGKENDIHTKIKGAVDHLSKDETISKEEIKPFLNSLVAKVQVSDQVKKQLLSIGSDSPAIDEKMPTSTIGAAKKIQELASQVKTPEEAQKKAEDGLKKSGLKGKLLQYEAGIYKWIGKLPLVGGWFSKQSKTKQRIIVLIAIAILSYLVYQGVKWAIKVMSEASTSGGNAQGASGASSSQTTPDSPSVEDVINKGIDSNRYASMSNQYSTMLKATLQRRGDIGHVLAKMAEKGFSPDQIADTLEKAGIHGEDAIHELQQTALAYAGVNDAVTNNLEAASKALGW